MANFNIDSWNDFATLIGIVAAISTAAGVLGTQFYNRIKTRIDVEDADDKASDRLIQLIEKEADKRVAIVRAEFELKFAELKLEHARELTELRKSFERQIEQLRKERADFFCENALACIERVEQGGTPRPAHVPPGSWRREMTD